MNSLARPGQRQTPWARRALGILVLVWLNVSLQPCAMAMVWSDAPDCPHCPPSDARPYDVHEMPSDAMGWYEMPCATGVTDCDLLNKSSIDSRTGQIKVKNESYDPPAAVIPTAGWLTNTRTERVMVVAPFVSDLAVTSPPLNVLHCVYLN